MDKEFELEDYASLGIPEEAFVLFVDPKDPDASYLVDQQINSERPFIFWIEDTDNLIDMCNDFQKQQHCQVFYKKTHISTLNKSEFDLAYIDLLGNKHFTAIP
jgi:hypothetical protein